MDMIELWERTCALLRSDMNDVSYRTWIEGNLTPVRLENDTLTLRIAMENMKVMVNNRYAPQIASCLLQVCGHRMNVVILTKDEIEGDQKKASAASNAVSDTLPLNPKYTFESFVVGASNEYVQAAAFAVADA